MRILARATMGLALLGSVAAVEPAAVSAQGDKPENYGDCVSAIAATEFFSGTTTVKEFTQTSRPIQSRGRNPDNEDGISCAGFPPPAPRP
jgi:hypothetical protein